MSSKVIALDGPAASGKSTLAAALAEKLGIVYVNTGSLYRAVALLAQGADSVPASLLNSLDVAYCRNDAGLYELSLNGSFPGAALRTPEVAARASRVAAQPAVRAALLDVQRKMAEKGWIVMEGRDIGTVVFPDAAFKFFVTATPEERARRRLAQTGESAEGATLEEVAAMIRLRDDADANRAVAPLRPAADTLLLDTTGRSVAEMVEELYPRLAEAVCCTK